MKRVNVFMYALMLTVFVACSNKDTQTNEQEKKEVKTEQQLDPSIVNNPVSASSPEIEGKELPKFSFEREEHDFGTITEGEKVSYSFKFKNSGTADLLIRSASGSCGCTVPEYPKDPIKPGKEGIIKVTFDSSGKSGQQQKTVTLLANTIPNQFILTIKGNVLKAQS